MYEDIAVFVPGAKEVVIIREGIGDNLLEEDIEEGYIDYVTYDTYKFIDGEIEEYDGGMVLLKEHVREKYLSMEDAIPDVMEMAYGYRGEITYPM